MADTKSKKLGEKIFDDLFGEDNLGRTLLTTKDYERTRTRIKQGADLNVYLGGNMLLDHALLQNNLSLAKLFREYGARFEAEGLSFYKGQVQINCPSALLTCSCTPNVEEYSAWITQQVPTGPLFPFLNEGRECNDTPALIYLAINDFPNLNTVLTHAKIKPSEKELHHISNEDRDKYISLCKVQSHKVFKLSAKYGLRSILSWCINQGIKNITLEKEDIRDDEIALFIQRELHKRDHYKQNLTKFTQARHLSFHTKPNRPQLEPENQNCIVPTI